MIIGHIAREKGWTYRPRSGKVEIRFGYAFTGKGSDGRYYRCRIKADNPVDAADRLKPIEDVVSEFQE